MRVSGLVCLGLLLLVGTCASAKPSLFDIQQHLDVLDSVSPVSSGKMSSLRWIEFNETHREWLTEEQVLQLTAEKKTFIDVTDHPDLNPSANHFKTHIPTDLNEDAADPIAELIAKLSKEEIKKTITELSDLHTRYYQTQTGKDAAVYLHQRYVHYIGDAPYASVRFFAHSWLQPSVIARIQGKGPRANEVVIIGGHEDSINGPTGRAPGADDDASGVSTVLEVFRVLREAGWGDKFVPDRSVEFHSYAAEEVGLRGSQDIAQAYLNDGVHVAGMLQLDMTGYVKNGTKPVIGLVTDYTNVELTQYVRKLVTAWANIPPADTKCGYGCSDHASWTKAGYPSAFPFESMFNNLNPYIHTTQDLVSRLDFDHAIEYAKVAVAFIADLSLE
jgi:leucyl aminopeptidase